MDKNNVQVNFTAINLDKNGNEVEIVGATIGNIMDPNYQKELFKALVDGHIIIHKYTKTIIKFNENGILVFYIESVNMWDKSDHGFPNPDQWMLAENYVEENKSE